MTRSDRLVRIVAAATAAYGTALTVAPSLLARPARLRAPDGTVPPATAALIRSIGVRDAVLALCLMAAPAGRTMTMLSTARVISDASDAVWFGRTVPPTQRPKIAGAALGWAALEASVALSARRQSR
jgi:hypothetical protein